MKKHSKIIGLLLIITFISVISFKISAYYKESQFKKSLSAIIQKEYAFYTPERISDFNVDSLLFYKMISEKLGQPLSRSVDEAYAKHKEDPFKRFYNKNDYEQGLVFKRNLDSDINQLRGQKIDTLDAFDYYKKTGDFYLIDGVPNMLTFQPWNRIVLKALYCDISGYDSQDFSYIKFMERSNGGYVDTHMLLALLFLEKNNCYNKQDLIKEEGILAKNITDAENNDTYFSDLYTERIAMLYWSGFGDKVKSSWIEKIANNSIGNSGWGSGEKELSPNSHTTGLAILDILYYIKDKTSRSLY